MLDLRSFRSKGLATSSKKMLIGIPNQFTYPLSRNGKAVSKVRAITLKVLPLIALLQGCQGYENALTSESFSSPSPSSEPSPSPTINSIPPLYQTGICYPVMSSYQRALEEHQEKIRKVSEYTKSFNKWLPKNQKKSQETVNEYNRRLEVLNNLQKELQEYRPIYCPGLTLLPTNHELNFLPKQKGKTLPNTLLQGSLTSSRQRKA